MRLRKEGFDALVQRRVEDIIYTLELIHPDLLSHLSELGERPSSKSWNTSRILKNRKS